MKRGKSKPSLIFAYSKSERALGKIS